MAFADIFSRLLGRRAAAIAALSLLTTWLCLRQGWTAEFPTTLISVAIVFPIVFSINAAYNRRESALKSLGSIKASAIALLLAHRDWGQAGRETGIPALLGRMFAEMRPYFDPTVGGQEEHRVAIYEVFDGVSKANEALRAQEVPANEVSRANQYLRYLIADFENMRIVREYRTPQSLRAYSTIFLNAFPILFGPTFAQLSADGPVWAGFLVAALYSLVLVSLDRVQDDLEDPFDGVGMDDIGLDVAWELEAATGKPL